MTLYANGTLLVGDNLYWPPDDIRDVMRKVRKGGGRFWWNGTSRILGTFLDYPREWREVGTWDFHKFRKKNEPIMKPEQSHSTSESSRLQYSGSFQNEHS